MHFSSAAAVLALVSAATASTEGYLHDAGDQLALARAAIMYFTRDASSILSPASIPNAIRATASRIDKAAAEAMDVKSITPDCETAATEYSKLSSSLAALRIRLIRLAYDTRFKEVVREDIVKAVRQLGSSVNNLAPEFVGYCPTQLTFPTQTVAINTNLELVAVAFEAPCILG